MGNVFYYILIIIVIFYILSPLDLHPSFLDDIIASVILFYLWRRNAHLKSQRAHAHYRNQSQGKRDNKTAAYPDIKAAYRTLGVKPGAPLEEVRKAYKEKIARTHPDKTVHLSEELQEKAKELTIKLNNAFDMIKRNKTG